MWQKSTQENSFLPELLTKWSVICLSRKPDGSNEEWWVLFCGEENTAGTKICRKCRKDGGRPRWPSPEQTKPKLIVKTCFLVNQTQPKLAFFSKWTLPFWCQIWAIWGFVFYTLMMSLLAAAWQEIISHFVATIESPSWPSGSPVPK